VKDPKDEASFRALLDDRGVLRPGVLSPPDRSATFAVFAQRHDAMLDLGAIKTHATRFFDTKLGLTVEKRYALPAPDSDAARVVLASNDGLTSGTRFCFARPASSDDYAAAEDAERRQGTTGMSLLAQRCPILWLVTREAEDDRVALTIAAIFASTLLGPILSPAGDELFGVRTARMKLEGRSSPYR
jgi:hypothetical protein